MKILLSFFILFSITAFSTESGQTVHLTKDSKLKLIANCSSDEFAIVVTDDIHIKSESEYEVNVRCYPAKCLAVNNSGKISVYRTAILPKIGGNTTPQKYIRAELLATNITGGKENGINAAQEFVNKGVCKTVGYNYTNAFFKFINSL